MVSSGSKGYLKFQEGPRRTFTKRGKVVYKSNYCKHLEVFRLSSIERRTERYKILYIWKSVNNLVPHLGINWKERALVREGKMVEIPTITAKLDLTKTMKRQSLRHRRSFFFNLLSKEVRMLNGIVDQFKCKLDNFLKNHPDQPHVEGCIPDAVYLDGVMSNL